MSSSSDDSSYQDREELWVLGWTHVNTFVIAKMAVNIGIFECDKVNIDLRVFEEKYKKKYKSYQLKGIEKFDKVYKLKNI